MTCDYFKMKRHLKLLGPCAAQALAFRRLAYLERTIGPMVKGNWGALPTQREFAAYARAHIEFMYRSKGKQFSKASCNAAVSNLPPNIMPGSKLNPSPKVVPKYRNSDGTPRKLEDDFSKIRRWSIK